MGDTVNISERKMLLGHYLSSPYLARPGLHLSVIIPILIVIFIIIIIVIILFALRTLRRILCFLRLRMSEHCLWTRIDH